MMPRLCGLAERQAEPNERLQRKTSQWNQECDYPFCTVIPETAETAHQQDCIQKIPETCMSGDFWKAYNDV